MTKFFKQYCYFSNIWCNILRVFAHSCTLLVIFVSTLAVLTKFYSFTDFFQFFCLVMFRYQHYVYRFYSFLMFFSVLE